MANPPPIDDLIRYAGRNSVNRDWNQRLPVDTEDEGYYSKDFGKDATEIDRLLHSPPEIYQDPSIPEYIEVPATEKLIKNKKKGPKALKKMIEQQKLPYATDELPEPGTKAYDRMMRESITKQRGPRERT